jgi:RNA polymerase sigma-70 factor, ECF subfamily
LIYERDLVKKADAANFFTPTTFSHLLTTTQSKLYAFVRGMIGDKEQTRDIVQDVFYDAWRAAQSGKPPFAAAYDEQGIRRWLFHAAYCDAASALRRRTLIQWESLNDAGFMQREPLPMGRSFEDDVAERQVLYAALARLTPEESACLLLNVIQGFTAAEIAQIVGISLDACKKRLSRARHHLRAAYDAQHTEAEEFPS